MDLFTIIVFGVLIFISMIFIVLRVFNINIDFKLYISMVIVLLLLYTVVIVRLCLQALKIGG